MFLDFPLDFKTPAIIDKAVSLFGKVVKVQLDDPVRGRLMVKALYSSTLEVPRKIVFKRAAAFGGVGRSWTVSVFLCHGDLPNIMPADEDLLPVNHVPEPDSLPEHPPVQHNEIQGDNMHLDVHDEAEQSHSHSEVSHYSGSHHMVVHKVRANEFEMIL